MKNTSGIHVTHDKVLLRLLPVVEKTAGGIALPDETKKKEQQAQYVAWFVDAGPTAQGSEELTGIEPGMLLVHAKFAGFVVKGADGMYRIIRVTEVVGRVDAIYDERMQGSVRMPDNS